MNMFRLRTSPRGSLGLPHFSSWRLQRRWPCVAAVAKPLPQRLQRLQSPQTCRWISIA